MFGIENDDVHACEVCVCLWGMGKEKGLWNSVFLACFAVFLSFKEPGTVVVYVTCAAHTAKRGKYFWHT